MLRLKMVFKVLEQTEVFAHEVCDGSVRDEDEREIFFYEKTKKIWYFAHLIVSLPSEICTQLNIYLLIPN